MMRSDAVIENVKTISINVFELASYLVGSLFVGYGFGRLLSGVVGDAGWILGALFGLLAAVAALMAFTHLIEVWHSISPLQPVCSTGRCTAKDYRFQQSTDHGFVFECKCGERYLQSRHRFMKLDASNPRPYMRRRLTGQWQNDGTSVEIAN